MCRKVLAILVISLFIVAGCGGGEPNGNGSSELPSPPESAELVQLANYEGQASRIWEPFTVEYVPWQINWEKYKIDAEYTPKLQVFLFDKDDNLVGTVVNSQEVPPGQTGESDITYVTETVGTFYISILSIDSNYRVSVWAYEEPNTIP